MANKTRKNKLKKTRKNAGKRKSQRKNRNKNRKYKLLNIGGGCNCGSENDTPKLKLWNGGDSTGSQIHLYPYNEHTIDPVSPDMQVGARNLPDIADANTIIGGKKRRRTKKNRKMKGGGVGDAFLGTNPNMPIMSFGTTSGAYDFYNIMNGTNQVDSAPYSQPILQMYGDHNYPLV